MPVVTPYREMDSHLFGKPIAPCEARQSCYDRALSVLLKCNTAVTAMQGACTVGVIVGIDGFGFFPALMLCGKAMIPKRVACVAMYNALLTECDEIPCEGETE